MQLTNADFERILNIGIRISTERNRNHLLASILENGMQITHCDASTLYLYEDEYLKFKIMKTLSQNISQGVDGEDIDMPPVPLTEENVCAYTAIHREIVNIPDVYDNSRFDFSGPKRYDHMTGYHTRSMLVIPITNNEDELIGVLQLLNAQDEEGRVIPFDPEYEIIIRSLSSLAAVELTNLNYVEEIKQQLHSFVEAMTTAIDERTPYNASHTRKVAEYAALLADYVNRQHLRGKCPEYFDEGRREQLELAALLHDIGKMVVPLSVMNRATRLDKDMERLEERFKLLMAYIRIDALEGRITKEKCSEDLIYLKEGIEFIHNIDAVEYLDDINYERVQDIAGHCYITPEGEKIPYLTEREKKCLSIRRGTLIKEDRIVMENHVVMTAKILNKVHFNKNYADVPKWASAHHELLDGSGYPEHISGEELGLETRMLTIVDIYDALTADDRPYKKAIPKGEAIDILKDMAEKGKVELRLVEWLEEALKEQEVSNR